ncbi:MAG: nucleoside-diphosphate sugar epimerase/dehydratase [Ignavibacteriaceae bacterium]
MNFIKKYLSFNNSEDENLMMQRIKRHVRNRYYVFSDLIIFTFIPLLAFYIRFDGLNFPQSIGTILLFGLSIATLKILIMYFTGMYSRWWANASIDDLLLIIYSGMLIFVTHMVLLVGIKSIPFEPFAKIPYSIPVIDSVFTILFISFSRLTLRIFNHKSFKKSLSKGTKRKSTLIIGAGQTGIMVLEEFKRMNRGSLNIAGFIDDDDRKKGMKIRGVKVLGNRFDIPDIIVENKVNRIIIAIPSASGTEIKDIVDICNTVDDIEVLTVPALHEIFDGRIEIKKLRKVQIEDLLKRNPIRTDVASIHRMLKNKVVLVTGGGGSIGSELCRQIIRCKPDALLLLGHGENSVFEIMMELKNKYPEANIIPLIADVTDYDRMQSIFSTYEINIVFHAAAHKHVPLMEAHPYEAIKNNIVGTNNLTQLAIAFNVEKFIDISTDKAVNPSSVMGTSKRIGEMIVINAAKKFDRKFSVVRFGNVLGSRGSVVQIFKSQIKEGGPITITHPDINRYFMTIPEAVQLVLQAFIIGNGGDIFIFDMGKPVKIVDLAKDLIKLSGLELGKDIEIKITGLRPGEKLYEELFNGGEKFKNTVNEKIFIAENSAQIVPADFEEKLRGVIELAKNPGLDEATYKSYLKSLVPEFTFQRVTAKSIEWEKR